MNEIMNNVAKDPSYKDFEYALRTGNINALKYIKDSLSRRISTSIKIREYNDPTDIDALYLFQSIVNAMISTLECFGSDFQSSKREPNG